MIKLYNRIITIVVFVGLPILFYALGAFPQRTLLKETLSIVTIVAFFIMLLQFFLSRVNKSALQEHKMGKVIKWHKNLGYVFVGILLLHPFMMVLPRYFEAGIEPKDAFIILITTTNSKGVILGMIAWFLMLTIGVTSIFRNSLGLHYRSWRILHGVLSSLFIIVASIHAIDLGRHMNVAMVVLIILIASLALTLLFKKYFFKSTISKLRSHG